VNICPTDEFRFRTQVFPLSSQMKCTDGKRNARYCDDPEGKATPSRT
jgi:hypothetical protein